MSRLKDFFGFFSRSKILLRQRETAVAVVQVRSIYVCLLCEFSRLKKCSFTAIFTDVVRF